jgi:flavin reductase (DIM6/NTAB) family NADH-FMN oxidoreductase RutF
MGRDVADPGDRQATIRDGLAGAARVTSLVIISMAIEITRMNGQVTGCEKGARRMDQQAKKTMLRHFTYGLYAVTAAHGDERGIFTANWLTQVSFEPPLIALSVERESSTLPLIQASGHFAVCPLTTEQTDLAGALGRPKSRVGDKFAAYDLPIADSKSGVPVLANSLGYLVCRVVTELAAGDSILFVAEVVEAGVRGDGEPLTMRAAGFRHAG